MSALVLLEVGGIQRFIFSSVRLREQVGASHVVAGVLRPVVERLVGSALDPTTDDVEARLASPDALVLLLTSGKALVRVSDGTAGRDLIRAVCRDVIVDAPGLEVVGVTVPCPPGGLAAAIREAHRAVDRTRSDLPGPEVRFPVLPPVGLCTSSGLPAAMDRRPLGAKGRETEPQAVPTVLKEAESEAALLALRGSVERGGDGLQRVSVPRNIGEVNDLQGDPASWIAVVHADGDGIGDRLAAITATADGDAAVVEQYALLSRALVELSAAALATAVAETAEAAPADGGLIPVLPLVAGGDDLTAVVPGASALTFAGAYARAFTTLSSDPPDDAESLIYYQIASGDEVPFSACAGIAIVKSKYPFHHAYELAESALSSAKRRRRSVGADTTAGFLDVHVEYGVGLEELDATRERRRSVGDDPVVLHGGPWSLDDDGPAPSVAALQARVDALLGTDLSRSVQARLRTALGRGRDELAALVANAQPADASHLQTLLGDDLTLVERDGVTRSDLLDAYELGSVVREGQS